MLFTNRITQVCITIVFCALFLIHATAQQPPSSSAKRPKPAKGSTIRGRVLYADTGHPLRRAEVSLYAQDSQALSDFTVTDRSGEFVFSNISAGNYFVLVDAPDIVPPLEQKWTLGSLSLKIALGQIEDGFSEVSVDGQNSVKTEIRATRGGVITGRVLTESDEPIPKVQIKLYEFKDGKLRPARATEIILDRDQWKAQTDSRGVYRIAGLPTGEYIVRASESDEGGYPDDAAEDNYTNGSMMVAFYPKGQRLQDATRVKVQQGTETNGVDIRFVDRVPHRIAGSVFVRGMAASGAEIRLLRDEQDGETYRVSTVQARTDINGYWEIRAVPDGRYTLSISGTYLSLYEMGRERAYGHLTPTRRELLVDGGDVTDLKFDLGQGGILNGVVSVEGGTPVPNTLMMGLVSAETNTTLKSTSEDGTASETPDRFSMYGNTFVRDGTFSIFPLPPGLFRFRLSGLGPRHYVKSITLKDKDLLRDPIRIEDGKTLDGVRIVLATDMISLSGRVVDKRDRSKPLADAAVLLFTAEMERRRVFGDPIAARTDQEGRFIVKAPPGDYFVLAFDRRRKDIPIVMPTEATLIKNSSTLQKISVQRDDQKKVVEVVGP